MIATLRTLVLVLLLAATGSTGCKDAAEPASAEEEERRDYAPIVAAIDEGVVRTVLEERGYEVEEEWSELNISQDEADEMGREMGLGTDATSVSSNSLGARTPEDSYVSVTITTTGKPNYRAKGGTGWNAFMGHAYVGAGTREVSVSIFGTEVSEEEAEELSLEILDELVKAAGFEL